MRGSGLLLAALLYAVCAPLISLAQNVPALTFKPEEIGINAQELTYDRKTDTVVARGKVVIRRGDMVLHADEVRVNRATKQADAQGNVMITNPEGTASANVAHIDLDDETGFLEHATIQSRGLRYSLWGDRIEKGLGQSYHIENGRFTTCRCPDGGAPSWSISGRELDVDLDGYGKLRGGVFHVLDVPILYIPRAFFPVRRRRQSGFLMPRFSVSNRRGFQTLLPFYWAISKSQDATLTVDGETSVRAGFVGEYRYAWNREAHGVITGSYFNESFRGTVPSKPFEQDVPENRWSVTAKHRQQLGQHSEVYTNLFLVGDDLFVRDINTFAFEHTDSVLIRTLPFTNSRAGAVHVGKRFAVKGEGTFSQNLAGAESQTLQRAPEVTIWGQRRLAGPLLGQLQITGVDFQRGRSVDGFRVDLQPTVVLPLPLGRFGFGTVHGSVRETAYYLTERTLEATGRRLPRNRTRETFQLGAEVGTILNRVYPVSLFGLEKVKHTIEPAISYQYVPAVSQGDLPLFDGTDRVNRRNLVTYGLVSRLVGKFAGGARPTGTVRELARFSLNQSFDVSRKILPLQTGRAADHFSDIDFGGVVNPSRAFSLRFLTNYDAGTNNISAARVGLFVEDPREPPGSTARRLRIRSSASVSYRFLTQNLLQELDDNVVLRLTDWAGFRFASRFDVVANRLLDAFFGLKLVSSVCDCWSLDLGVVDRINPQEVQVRVQLTLVGLGSVGSTRGQSRYRVVP
ncbi:MAG: LPS-assembly protein LptD [Candidatus Binatia bacterium]